MLQHSYFVLEPVPSSFQVHVFCIGVIEAALTQFTVESNHLAVIISDLKTKTIIANKWTELLQRVIWSFFTGFRFQLLFFFSSVPYLFNIVMSNWLDVSLTSRHITVLIITQRIHLLGRLQRKHLHLWHRWRCCCCSCWSHWTSRSTDRLGGYKSERTPQTNEQEINILLINFFFLCLVKKPQSSTVTVIDTTQRLTLTNASYPGRSWFLNRCCCCFDWVTNRCLFGCCSRAGTGRYRRSCRTGSCRLSHRRHWEDWICVDQHWLSGWYRLA